MARTIYLGPERKEVSRVVQVGRGLYMLLPTKVAEKAGVKRGDRLCVDTNGRMIFMARIPWEELMVKRPPAKYCDPRAKVGEDGRTFIPEKE